MRLIIPGRDKVLLSRTHTHPISIDVEKRRPNVFAKRNDPLLADKVDRQRVVVVNWKGAFTA